MRMARSFDKSVSTSPSSDDRNTNSKVFPSERANADGPCSECRIRCLSPSTVDARGRHDPGLKLRGPQGRSSRNLGSGTNLGSMPGGPRDLRHDGFVIHPGVGWQVGVQLAPSPVPPGRLAGHFGTLGLCPPAPGAVEKTPTGRAP